MAEDQYVGTSGKDIDAESAVEAPFVNMIDGNLAAGCVREVSCVYTAKSVRVALNAAGFRCVPAIEIHTTHYALSRGVPSMIGFARGALHTFFHMTDEL